MSAFDQLHNEAQGLAEVAFLEVKNGNHDNAKRLFRLAWPIEQKAYDAIEPGKARTRGIVAVSVASLMLKAGEPLATVSAFVERVRPDIASLWALEQLDEILAEFSCKRCGGGGVINNAACPNCPGKP